MKFAKNLCFLSLVGLAVVSSCAKDGNDPGPEGPQGPNGLKSLLDIKPIAAGDKCSTGGLAVLSGIDKNANNKLEENEVENTQYICNGNNAQSDKQTIIDFGTFDKYIGLDNPVWYWLAMPRFNINNYPGVDSIILIGTPYSQYEPGGTATIELVNYVDKSIIENSAITSDVTYNGNYKHVVSKNFYNFFPKKEIDLGVRLSTTVPGNVPRVYGNVIMILYRK